MLFYNNIFKEYDSPNLRYGTYDVYDSSLYDYITYFDTKGAEVTITYLENEWTDLNVSRFILTDGPVNIIAESMDISNNRNFLISNDPKEIRFTNVHFSNFKGE